MKAGLILRDFTPPDTEAVNALVCSAYPEFELLILVGLTSAEALTN